MYYDVMFTSLFVWFNSLHTEMTS